MRPTSGLPVNGSSWSTPKVGEMRQKRRRRRARSPRGARGARIPLGGLLPFKTLSRFFGDAKLIQIKSLSCVFWGPALVLVRTAGPDAGQIVGGFQHLRDCPELPREGPLRLGAGPFSPGAAPSTRSLIVAKAGLVSGLSRGLQSPPGNVYVTIFMGPFRAITGVRRSPFSVENDD